MIYNVVSMELSIESVAVAQVSSKVTLKLSVARFTNPMKFDTSLRSYIPLVAKSAVSISNVRVAGVYVKISGPI